MDSRLKIDNSTRFLKIATCVYEIPYLFTFQFRKRNPVVYVVEDWYLFYVVVALLQLFIYILRQVTQQSQYIFVFFEKVTTPACWPVSLRTQEPFFLEIVKKGRQKKKSPHFYCRPIASHSVWQLQFAEVVVAVRKTVGVNGEAIRIIFYFMCKL